MLRAALLIAFLAGAVFLIAGGDRLEASHVASLRRFPDVSDNSSEEVAVVLRVDAAVATRTRIASKHCFPAAPENRLLLFRAEKAGES
jgi:hypothetical protein